MEQTMNNNTNVSSPQRVLTVTNPLPQIMNMNVGNSVSGVNTTGTSMVVSTVAVSTTTTTMTPGSSGGGSFDLFGKKKRGRPRKYDADGNLNPNYKKIEKTPTTTTPLLPPPPGFTLSSNEFSSKKGRGKPTGFGNYQILSSFGEFWNLKVLNFIQNVLMGIFCFLVHEVFEAKCKLVMFFLFRPVKKLETLLSECICFL